jgi:hypothetical protein
MRAMETTPAASPNAGEDIAFAQATGTSRRASGWAGGNAARKARVSGLTLSWHSSSLFPHPVPLSLAVTLNLHDRHYV